ncbi:hypothetical protein P8452_53338 [Trifolium repens]|nr:hypothetical protein P8452_53338 [Trifolium repens]
MEKNKKERGKVEESFYGDLDAGVGRWVVGRTHSRERGFRLAKSEIARMTDEVTRQRGGRDSVAHSSARRERLHCGKENIRNDI